MKKIPKSLIYLRLVLGIIILYISLFYPDCAKAIPVTLFTIGLLSDIFDGIIARRLNISTELLRRLDSSIDQSHWLKLLILTGIEALTYIISFARFRKEVATHAITSKIWTLVLFATLIELMIEGDSTLLFDICFYAGVITRFEIILILLTLKTWTNDVPSFYHAVRLRQGKPIKRHKLFNG